MNIRLTNCNRDKFPTRFIVAGFGMFWWHSWVWSGTDLQRKLRPAPSSWTCYNGHMTRGTDVCDYHLHHHDCNDAPLGYISSCRAGNRLESFYNLKYSFVHTASQQMFLSPYDMQGRADLSWLQEAFSDSIKYMYLHIVVKFTVAMIT